MSTDPVAPLSAREVAELLAEWAVLSRAVVDAPPVTLETWGTPAAIQFNLAQAAWIGSVTPQRILALLATLDRATEAAWREGIEWALGAVAQRIWNDWQGDSRAQIAYRTIEEVRARAQGAGGEGASGGGE